MVTAANGGVMGVEAATVTHSCTELRKEGEHEQSVHRQDGALTVLIRKFDS